METQKHPVLPMGGTVCEGYLTPKHCDLELRVGEEDSFLSLCLLTACLAQEFIIVSVITIL